MDANKLRSLIIANNSSTKTLLDACEISRSKYYKALKGKTYFNTEEVRKIGVVLQLDADQICAVFFS